VSVSAGQITVSYPEVMTLADVRAFEMKTRQLAHVMRKRAWGNVSQEPEQTTYFKFDDERKELVAWTIGNP
jgi:hypothetical protein